MKTFCELRLSFNSIAFSVTACYTVSDVLCIWDESSQTTRQLFIMSSDFQFSSCRTSSVNLEPLSIYRGLQQLSHAPPSHFYHVSDQRDNTHIWEIFSATLESVRRLGHMIRCYLCCRRGFRLPRVIFVREYFSILSES